MTHHDQQLPRVAVVGVIRGGTSMAVGLLRILGWHLTGYDPSCIPGEDRQLRFAGASTVAADVIAARVNQLPHGVVWKDPAVALYADLINWDRWRIVRITRTHQAIVNSMLRWAEIDPEPRDVLARRVIDWNTKLDRAVGEGDWTIDADLMRETPDIALAGLANTLLDRYPTTAEIQAAYRFIGAGSGYRCPVPDWCEIDRPGHDAGRMASPPRR